MTKKKNRRGRDWDT